MRLFSLTVDKKHEQLEYSLKCTHKHTQLMLISVVLSFVARYLVVSSNSSYVMIHTTYIKNAVCFYVVVFLFAFHINFREAFFSRIYDNSNKHCYYNATHIAQLFYVVNLNIQMWKHLLMLLRFDCYCCCDMFTCICFRRFIECDINSILVAKSRELLAFCILSLI